MDRAETGLSRRNLLFVIGGATLAAGALVMGPFRSEIGRRAGAILGARPLLAPTLARASYEEWSAWTGTRFVIGGVAMELAGVRALPSEGARPTNLRQRAFVAFFDPIGAQTMAGDLIYTATLSRHAPLQIFLSGSPDPRTPARMLAVFN